MNNTTDDVAPMSRGHVLRGINSNTAIWKWVGGQRIDDLLLLDY